MQQPPRTAPRFVPTLTEVVQISVPPVVPVLATPPAALSGNPDDMVDRLMHRLDGPLQTAIGNILSSLAVDHFKKLEPLLRDEIDRAVRRAVDDALAAELDAQNPG
jgi:hypothetical protein